MFAKLTIDIDIKMVPYANCRCYYRYIVFLMLRYLSVVPDNISDIKFFTISKAGGKTIRTYFSTVNAFTFGVK